MNKFRCAVIGLGHQSLSDHIPSINKSDYAELVAIADLREEIVKKYSEELNVPGYKDFVKMLDKEKIDFVIIATPHNTHLSMVEEVSKRGIHILKEKPLARTLKEAYKINSLVEKSNINLMIGVQRRFNIVYSSFFHYINFIGKPFFIEGKYTIFTDSPNLGWRGSREASGGGCIIDMGYHLIDLLIWYFGLPDEINAKFSSNAKPHEFYDAEDTSIINFRYDYNNLYGNFIISRSMPPKTEFLKIYGSLGIIEITKNKISRLSVDGKLIESITIDKNEKVESIKQIDNFCMILQGKIINLNSPLHHLQHMKFIDACYKLLEKNILFLQEKNE